MESVDTPDLKSVDHYGRASSSLATRIYPKYFQGKLSPMKYHIDTKYAWYDHHEGSTLILLYFIQNVPFTFDELPEIAKSHPEVVTLADQEKRWEPEELYKSSMYLMAEECHPLMFDLELENPELLPVD